ncbi:MAG: hypothetical protein L0Y50_07230 [Beijerinckiaceae bacterium]|nr:hypothetical protein [Beijerinckiaceae bacterium]MCI0736049.1 hypothetical protein [Beijerinckiaceae bacterium]
MTVKKRLLAFTALAAPAVFLGSAFAHESRIIPASTGHVRVTVGFHAEPAFEDVAINGLDLFLFTFDGRCPIDTTDFFGNAITQAEITSIKTEVLYLDKSAMPTGTLGSSPPTLAKILKKADTPARGVFGEPGNYHSNFIPTHPGAPPAPDPHGAASSPQTAPETYKPKHDGAYGFYVEATVNTQESEYTCDADSTTPTKKTIPARTTTFKSYWICGTGAFRDGTPESRGAFSCVNPAPTFPGNAEDAYEPNKPFKGRGGRES